MSEVQAHGKDYEDHVIFERTGLSKREYDALKKNGYTSELDLCKELIVNYHGSIKSSKSNTINCADLLRKMKHKEYRLIIGLYKQVGKKKVFHTQYEFYILPEHYELLWGDMKYEVMEQYVNKIKSIENGKKAQKEYQLVKKQWKSEVKCDKSLFIINPKVDSKEQRRVQCSIHLDKLIASGIKYTVETIDFVVESPPRKIKK